MPSATLHKSEHLQRAIKLPGAILMGLGSILGTGIFVSLGIVADVAGVGVLIAVLLSAVIAIFNGFSSAQLAASHPVSGGTYEYGYRYLNPLLGFSAGWMFLCAKTASAATAALAFAGYGLHMFGYSAANQRTGLGLAATVLLTLVVVGGIRRSNRANALIVLITLTALTSFIVCSLYVGINLTSSQLTLTDLRACDPWSVVHATALMFVAYTGYGRIATLGEEVQKPTRTIPQAIIITLLLAMSIYLLVAITSIMVVGADGLAEITFTTGAPLEAITSGFGLPILSSFIAFGAITAMLGVLLNLILGISRVVLAMARRGDLPVVLAVVNHGSPIRAVAFTGFLIAAFVFIGNVKTTWTFSAFTVLVYYGITNLAALKLPAKDQRFPRLFSWCGLLSCFGVAVFVEPEIWFIGLMLLVAGGIWHTIVHHKR